MDDPTEIDAFESQIRKLQKDAERTLQKACAVAALRRLRDLVQREMQVPMGDRLMRLFAAFGSCQPSRQSRAQKGRQTAVSEVVSAVSRRSESLLNRPRTGTRGCRRAQ